QGQQRADLSWNGATLNNIDVYRNGVLIATVPNVPGFYTDNIGARGKGTYIYRVCGTGTQNCSNQVRVKFGGGERRLLARRLDVSYTRILTWASTSRTLTLCCEHALWAWD